MNTAVSPLRRSLARASRALVVTLSFVLPAASARALPEERVSPYLFYDTAGELHLAWRSALASDDGTVQLFRHAPHEAQGSTERVLAARVGDLYRARLPARCDDGEELSYRVAGMREPAIIRRPPCPDDHGRAVRFSFLTDTQQDAALSGRFAQRVASRDAHFVLHGGDVVQVGGDEAQWRAILNELARFSGSIPLVPAAGNHEYLLDAEGALLEKYLGLARTRSWYRFSAGAVDVFVLNSCFVFDREERNRQVAWLRDALSSSASERPEAWRVVLFHHAPYSLGVAHSPWLTKREHAVMRTYYVPAFEELGVDLVLSGHTHLYERSFKDGVHYVVGGAAGGVMGWFGGENPYSVVSRQERTLSHLEARRGRLELVTETLQGEVIDRLSLSRPPSLIAAEGERKSAVERESAVPDRRSAR